MPSRGSDGMLRDAAWALRFFKSEVDGSNMQSRLDTNELYLRLALNLSYHISSLHSWAGLTFSVLNMS